MSKPFNIHDWQDKQKQQLLNEADGPISRGEGQKERLVQTLVNVFDGRLGNWYSDSPTSMSDVQKLFNRDREAIVGMIRSHLRDVTVNPRADIDTTSGGGVNEMSATGTGASFGAGAGEAFASPNAFKKKRK